MFSDEVALTTDLFEIVGMFLTGGNFDREKEQELSALADTIQSDLLESFKAYKEALADEINSTDIDSIEILEEFLQAQALDLSLDRLDAYASLYQALAIIGTNTNLSNSSLSHIFNDQILTKLDFFRKMINGELETVVDAYLLTQDQNVIICENNEDWSRVTEIRSKLNDTASHIRERDFVTIMIPDYLTIALAKLRDDMKFDFAVNLSCAIENSDFLSSKHTLTREFLSLIKPLTEYYKKIEEAPASSATAMKARAC